MQDTPLEPKEDPPVETQTASDPAPPANETHPRHYEAQHGPPAEAEPEVSERRRWVAGIVLVILGLFFLAQQFFGDFWSWAKWWPLILIVIGLFILVRSRRP
jgi:hypothetical protein